MLISLPKKRLVSKIIRPLYTILSVLRFESSSSLFSLQNLKLYRHPKILRFLNCCPGPDDVKYLFTEKTSPLALVLGQQSALQGTTSQ